MTEVFTPLFDQHFNRLVNACLEARRPVVLKAACEALYLAGLGHGLGVGDYGQGAARFVQRWLDIQVLEGDPTAIYEDLDTRRRDEALGLLARCQAAQHSYETAHTAGGVSEQV